MSTLNRNPSGSCVLGLKTAWTQVFSNWPNICIGLDRILAYILDFLKKWAILGRTRLFLIGQGSLYLNKSGQCSKSDWKSYLKPFGRGSAVKLWEEKDHWFNEWMIKLFVEQSLASPGSPKYEKIVVWWPALSAAIYKLIWNSSLRTLTTRHNLYPQCTQS